MTAGNCYPFSVSYLFPVRRGELGKAVSPASLRSVRGGSIDDDDIVILYICNRFNSRSIRQTKECDIRSIYKSAYLFGILSFVRVYLKELYIVSLFKSFKYPKACGAFASVNKNLFGINVFIALLLCYNIYTI